MVATIINKKGLFTFLLVLCSVFSQSQAMELIKKTDTSRLQELATLLYDQQYFIECIDAMVHDEYDLKQAHSNVADAISRACDHALEDLAGTTSKEILQGDSPKDSCVALSHLLSALKRDHSYAHIVAAIDSFKQEKLLMPLQQLIDILKTYNPTKPYDQEFLKIHNELYMRFFPICNNYIQILSEIKKYYDKIRDELIHHRERTGIAIRRHYYYDQMIPDTYIQSEIYIPLLEKSSEATRASLLASTKKSDQEEKPQADAKQRVPRTSKALNKKKKKSVKATTGKEQLCTEPIKQNPAPRQEPIVLTPAQENDLRMKNLYAAFQFQHTWMQKLWDASNQASTKLNPLLDQIMKIFASDPRFMKIFTAKSLDEAESLGDLQYMQRILLAINQPKSDARYKIIKDAITTWYKLSQESQCLEKINQLLGDRITIIKETPQKSKEQS